MRPDTGPTKIEYERDSDVRPRMAEKMTRLLNTIKNIKGFEGRSIEEIFGNEDSRRSFLLKITPQDYNQLIIGINGVLRNRNRYEWKMDGQNVLMGDEDIFPEFEDKEVLLTSSLTEAQKMVKEGRSIQDIATLLSAALVSVHPFEDGNGRTTKFIMTLISNGYTKSDETFFKEILSSDFSSDIERFSNYLFSILEVDIGTAKFNGRDFIYDFENSKYENQNNIVFSSGVSEEMRKDFITALNRSNYMFLAIAVYFKKDINLYYKIHSGAERSLFIPELDSESVNGIMHEFRFIKKRMVELLIDCIANPDKEEYRLPYDENQKEGIIYDSVLNLFKKEIKKLPPDALINKMLTSS